MVERRIHFGELCQIHRDIKVGNVPIHPGDTIQQQYGSSTTGMFLVRGVDSNGAVLLYQTPHLEVPIIYPGAKITALYCPH